MLGNRKRHAKPQSLTCFCGTSPKLIFACSGTSDVGELADRAAKSPIQTQPADPSTVEEP